MLHYTDDSFMPPLTNKVGSRKLKSRPCMKWLVLTHFCCHFYHMLAITKNYSYMLLQIRRLYLTRHTRNRQVNMTQYTVQSELFLCSSVPVGAQNNHNSPATERDSQPTERGVGGGYSFCSDTKKAKQQRRTWYVCPVNQKRRVSNFLQLFDTCTLRHVNPTGEEVVNQNRSQARPADLQSAK